MRTGVVFVLTAVLVCPPAWAADYEVPVSGTLAKAIAAANAKGVCSIGDGSIGYMGNQWQPQKRLNYRRFDRPAFRFADIYRHRRQIRA